MSTEIKYWVRDIRLSFRDATKYLFHIPENKHERTVWVTVSLGWILFLTVLGYAAITRG